MSYFTGIILFLIDVIKKHTGTVETTYYKVKNDIPDKTIPSHVPIFGWFFIAHAICFCHLVYSEFWEQRSKDPVKILISGIYCNVTFLNSNVWRYLSTTQLFMDNIIIVLVTDLFPISLSSAYGSCVSTDASKSFSPKNLGMVGTRRTSPPTCPDFHK